MPAAFAKCRCLSPYHVPVSSPRRIARSMRISRTTRSCTLLVKGYVTYPPAHGSEVSPAARNTLDSARIPRASKLLICGLFQKGRVLAQDGEPESPTSG